MTTNIVWLFIFAQELFVEHMSFGEESVELDDWKAMTDMAVSINKNDSKMPTQRTRKMMILVKELSRLGRETGNRVEEEHITD